MTATNHSLNQPKLIDPDDRAPPERLGNQSIIFDADPNCNLHDLFWPWANAHYARRIDLRITELQNRQPDELIPMITRRYPGHQETIYGNEGVIISKQIAAPFDSDYNQSVLWLLACQAEGDRLLRVDIEIDWGEPLVQRMVDGLLVAQQNPGPERGLYNQQNAESTRVFGNPEGRPDKVDIDDPQHAKLTYHILVNGETEVTFLLAISDVGEQMAWNGFLAQSDGKRVLQQSTKRWANLVSMGCVWTPDPQRNRQVQAEKIATILQTQRLQSGLAPTNRLTESVPRLVENLDLCDITTSRNLLNHLRQIAEKSSGRLPSQLPLRRRDKLPDPADQLAATNSAYLSALHQHLSHHASPKLLAEHYPAVGLCAEMLVRFLENSGETNGEQASRGLLTAAALAQHFGDEENSHRWRTASSRNLVVPLQQPTRDGTATKSIWSQLFELPLGHQPVIREEAPWPWWALLDLPWPDPDSPAANDRTLTIVCDGERIHATQPISCALPVQFHTQIRALHTDEDAFDLTFEFVDESSDGDKIRTQFKPTL